MVDTLTPTLRHLNMSRIRSSNTAAEVMLRKSLHARGFRYALNKRDLPGSPDIVLSKFRTAIFVHGCFWHGHNCHRSRVPSTRTEFWVEKIMKNEERDGRSEIALVNLGWRLIIA